MDVTKLLGMFIDLTRPPWPVWKDPLKFTIKKILEDILNNDNNHKKCDIEILSDFNTNMLNFETHGLTNDYINSLVCKSFLLMIN